MGQDSNNEKLQRDSIMKLYEFMHSSEPQFVGLRRFNHSSFNIIIVFLTFCLFAFFIVVYFKKLESIAWNSQLHMYVHNSVVDTDRRIGLLDKQVDPQFTASEIDSLALRIGELENIAKSLSNEYIVKDIANLRAKLNMKEQTVLQGISSVPQY